jgi:SAM-dependent methyltransferase
MGTVLNSDEEQFWSGPSGQSWVTYETEQDALLSEVLDAVLQRAGLKPGDAVMDVGCGTGALSVAAAGIIGDSGHGLATDISAPMLARAAERLKHAPRYSTQLADAEAAEWSDDGFDAAISRFGVMFFGNPARAFANIARAVRPGGRMTFAAWGAVDRNPYWRDPPRIASARLGDIPKGQPNTPGPMGLADIDWSVGQLREAGLADVACEEVAVHLPVHASPEKAAELALAIGPAARAIRLFEASSGDKAAIRDDIARDLEQYHDGTAVRIPALLNLYTARVV